MNIKKAFWGVGLVTVLISRSVLALTVPEQATIYESYTLEAQGQVEKSLQKMLSVHARNSSDYLVNYRLGWLFYLTKKYKNSLEHYQKATSLSPSSIEPWLGMSTLYVNLGDYDNTVKMCHEVLNRDPHNYTATQRVIFAQLRLKDFSNAAARARQALNLYPSDAVFLEQAAVALKESGHQDEAKAVANALILISPKNVYAKSLLGGKI